MLYVFNNWAQLKWTIYNTMNHNNNQINESKIRNRYTFHIIDIIVYVYYVIIILILIEINRKK